MHRPVGALAPEVYAHSILCKEIPMELSDLTPLYNLFYAIGEILTTTWPGRLILGMIVGSLLTRFARA
jgi:hypothetical protein